MFATEEAKQDWKGQRAGLLRYHRALSECDFASGVAAAEELLESQEARFKSLGSSSSDAYCNDHFLIGVALDLLSNYASYWPLLLAPDFQESWMRLQDFQNRIRTLRRFSKSKVVAVLDFLEDQSSNLEKLYPYKIFSSLEAVYGQKECSICGENMNSTACPHIKGELYRGALAVGIIKEVKRLHAVSLVENPRDKRCVIRYGNDGPQFRFIRYFSELVEARTIGPLTFETIRERRISLSKQERRRLGRNRRCPCGSGLKYKKCCIRKATVERDHLDIVASERVLLQADQLVHLPRISQRSSEPVAAALNAAATGR